MSYRCVVLHKSLTFLGEHHAGRFEPFQPSRCCTCFSSFEGVLTDHRLLQVHLFSPFQGRFRAAKQAMQRTRLHDAQRCLLTVRDRLLFPRDPFFTTVCIGEWVVKQPPVVTLVDQAATPGRHRVAWTSRVSAFGACLCAPGSAQARSRRSRSLVKLLSFVGKDLKRRRTSTARPRSGKGVVDSRRKEVDLKKGARDEVG